ncbi:hypothetical protein NE865_01207 [Phthorimaea operculella]|nr:hypothetical protein NE865_01207 [Phthorimaea operculella]
MKRSNLPYAFTYYCACVCARRRNKPIMDAKSFCMSFVWFLILVFISFNVAGIASYFYIFVYPCSICCPGCTPFADILLRGVQFPGYCAQAMLDGGT